MKEINSSADTNNQWLPEDWTRREGYDSENGAKIITKGHEETFLVMDIFFILIVITVSWHSFINVNVIYVNYTSIYTYKIF